jgi:lysyl-tRNA synthetase class 2
LKNLVKKIKKEINYGEHKISFLKKFNTISYFDVLKRFALIPEPEKANREDFALRAEQFGIKVENFDTKEKIMDNIFKRICLPKIIQPTFVVDYPFESSPLAKRKEDNRNLIDRFQLIIGGEEIANGFSELNDFFDQKERFLEQDKKRKAGEVEISPSDEDYLEAMEYGMPPAAGVGFGIDRLAMLLTNTYNIREVILFPILKPKN